MLVIGYTGVVDETRLWNSLRKHTDFIGVELNKAVINIRAGNPVILPDDFVLREELEDLNIKIQ